MSADFTWARYGGYEVSTAGDRRFSAFNALLADGRSIEQHFQCDVKGYDVGGTNWRAGKGKPPLVRRDLYPEYLYLWHAWARAHPEAMRELRFRAADCRNLLSDRFASSPNNQARALADLLNLGLGV